MPTDSLVPGIFSTPGLASGADIVSQKKSTPQKTHEAAEQFEALMVGQILKAAHEEDGGWLGAGEDQTASSAMQMADQYFARALTARGGLGLTQMISKGLERGASAAASSSNPVK